MKQDERNYAVQGKVFSAAKWGAAGTMARIVVQVVAQLILVRLLGPEAFGIYAVGAITLGLAAFLVDMGIGPALVQKPELSEADIRFAFTLQLMVGVSITAVLLILSPLIAQGLNQPDSTPILRVLSVVCLISAGSAVSQNILRRRLDFKMLHIGQVSSFVFGYFFFGMTLALMGYGVWAIVASVVMQNLFFAVWVLYFSSHPKKLLFIHPEGAQSMLRFGLKAFLTNLLNWVISNIDRIVVARFFPGYGLGVYNTTYNLILAPTGQVLGLLQSILFPASSRVQSERLKLVGFCRAGLSVGAIIVIPAFGAVSAFAVQIVSVLYGAAWSDAGPVLAAISMAMIPYCLMGILTPVIWGIGKVEIEGKVQVVTILVLAVLTIFASSISFVAVAWAVAIAFLFRFLAILYVFCLEFDVGFFSFLNEILPGFVLGFASWGGASLALSYCSKEVEASMLLQITCGGASFILAWVLAVPLVLRTMSFDGATLLLNVVSRSGSRPAKFFARELVQIISRNR